MTTTPSGPTPVGGEKPPPRPLLGILFMCIAGSVFPVMNGLVQVLSTRYDSEQIVFARTASHLLVVLAIFMPRLGAGVVRTTQPYSQIARSCLLLASTFLFFNGVKHLELAQAASISFMAPFIVVLLALPMLGEPITLHRIAAVTAGFVGVLIVIRPGSAVFQWASMLIVGSACCYALYQIYTRRVAGHDRPETSAFYSALIGTLVMAGVVLWHGWTPPRSWLDAGLLASLGVLGAAGHYCVARAMTYAAANVVAPFQYWQMVGSVAVGYLITERLPDAYTWGGAAVIIGAGLYIGWRDARRT